MNLSIVNGFVTFVVLLLIQVLVLNHVHLFRFAVPLMYVYMVLMFRRNYPKWGILLWCFAMGLSVDLFSNTPGVAASAMTLAGFLQPYVLEMFLNRDSADDLEPSMRSLGAVKFSAFTLIMVFVYCLTFFTVETFNFFNWVQWLLSVGGSTLLTAMLILVADSFRSRR